MRMSKFSKRQIAAILKEAEAGVTATAIARKHGISATTFYQRWRSEYGRIGHAAAARAGNKRTPEVYTNRWSSNLNNNSTVVIRRLFITIVALCLWVNCQAAVFLARSGTPTTLTIPNVLSEGTLLGLKGEFVQIGDMVFSRGTTPDSIVSGSLWPAGLVYYTFDSQVTDPNRTIFRQEIEHWSQVSSVQFVEDPFAQNIIVILNDTSACNSFVGMKGGAQQLKLAPRCWNQAVIHEMGHALGLVHEQQRPDRNTYVNVSFSGDQNCYDANMGIWQMLSTNETAYDYLSIMHYPAVTNETQTCDTGSYVYSLHARGWRGDGSGGQPPGDPQGSDQGCTDTQTCDGLMGHVINISSRDAFGVAEAYGYRFNVQLRGNGSGTYSISGANSCGGGCFQVPFGATATITAQPGPGSLSFISGDCTGRTSCQLTPTKNSVVDVRFVNLATIVALVSPRIRGDIIFANGFEP